MSDQTYNWRRYWYPREAPLQLDDRGYLYDPEGPLGAAVNPYAVRFDALAALPIDAVTPTQTRYHLSPPQIDVAKQPEHLHIQQLQAFGDMLQSLADVFPQNMRSPIMLRMIARTISTTSITEKMIRTIVDDYKLELSSEERAQCVEIFVKYLCL